MKLKENWKKNQKNKSDLTYYLQRLYHYIVFFSPFFCDYFIENYEGFKENDDFFC